MDANLWFLLGVLVLTVPLYMITDIANTSDTKDFFKKVLRVVCCYSGVYSTSGSGADGEVTVKGNALKISLRNETVAECDRGVFVCGVGGWVGMVCGGMCCASVAYVVYCAVYEVTSINHTLAQIDDLELLLNLLGHFTMILHDHVHII